MFCATTLRYFKGWRHPKNVAVSMKTKDIVKVGNNDFFCPSSFAFIKELSICSNYSLGILAVNLLR